jgi:hypothetical protein
MTVNSVAFEVMFISTPSHGYLQVRNEDVKAVGIEPSSYSVSDGMFFFLEEDSDAPEFLDVCSDAGFGVRMTHSNASHWEEYIESLW